MSRSFSPSPGTVPNSSPEQEGTAQADAATQELQPIVSHSKHRFMGLFTRSKPDTHRQKQSSEQLPPLRATPNVVAQLLEMKQAEVERQMANKDERKKLFKRIIDEKDHISQTHTFDEVEFERQMDVVGDMLAAKHEYVKKSFLSRAWDKIRNSFPARHPFWTAAAVLAAVGAGVYFGHAGGIGTAADILRDFFNGTNIANPGIETLPGLDVAGGVPPAWG